MENTIRQFLLVLMITGSLFIIGCESDDNQMMDDDETNMEEQVEDQNMEDDDMEVETNTGVEVDVDATVSGDDDMSMYTDGVYTATGTYNSPAGAESILVSMTVENDVVTAFSLTPQSENEVSLKFQNRVMEGAPSMIVGKNLAEVGAFSKINTSSLTPEGLNSAVADVKAQADS